jgi:hypothetical protein
LDFLYYLGNSTDIPFVFSTSYGEDEVSVSLDYATRMNEEFMKQVVVNRLIIRQTVYSVHHIIFIFLFLIFKCFFISFICSFFFYYYLCFPLYADSVTKGLRGVSFLFASGDSGVGSAFGSCTTFTPQVINTFSQLCFIFKFML